MKEKELRKRAICGICKRKVLELRIPLFYVVEIQRFGIDLNVVHRQAGLEQFIGNPLIAQVMGPDEDMATEFTEKETITVCESCAGKPITIHQLGIKES